MKYKKVRITYNQEDLDLSYVQEGREDAEEMVILHGFPGNITVYKKLIEFFAEYFHVTAIDLPGFGDSQSCQSNTILDMVECIHQFLLTKKIQSPVILGHSMGGVISYLLESRYPGVARAIITQGSPYSFETMTSKTRFVINFVTNHLYNSKPLKFEKILNFLLHSPSTSSIISRVVSIHPEYKRLTKVTGLETIKYSVKSLHSEIIRQVFLDFRSLDITNEIKKLDIPLLCLAGGKDKAVSCKYLEKINLINPKIVVKTYSKAEHKEIIENPQEMGQDILEFLRGL